MKSIPLPADFDGAKFAADYNLKRGEFFASGGMLYFPDSISSAPVTKPCDAPVPRPDAAIAAIRAAKASTSDLNDALNYLLRYEP